MFTQSSILLVFAGHNWSRQMICVLEGKIGVSLLRISPLMGIAAE